MDFTNLWTAFHQHRSRLALVLVGLLIFAAGWQLGRVMSPYYAARPIVFEDRQCEACSSSGGSRGELEALQNAGKTDAGKTVVGGNTSGVALDSPEVERVSTVAGTSRGQFVGSVNSNLFHAMSCPSVGRIKEANQIWFASVEKAEAAGYKPSKCTKEKLGL